jgi:membrane-bound lytic murein transglycosylase MltF
MTAAVCGLSMLLLTGCGATVPTDPDGTLDRASGGTLRVGVTENGTWVDVREGADPVGTEPELVESFASTLDAEVAWSSGSEEALVGDLEHGDLDLVIGGLTSDTPWSEKAGTTRPYTESTDELGATVEHVMLVPRGENRFLFELDAFLLGSDDSR